MEANRSHMPATSTSHSFFARVYALVARIPPGKVASYGQIAALLGAPKSARTVGWALHSLPQALEIPWHRVINSRGEISYNCRGHEADLQRMLLEAEGVRFDAAGKIDLSRFGWEISADSYDQAGPVRAVAHSDSCRKGGSGDNPACALDK